MQYSLISIVPGSGVILSFAMVGVVSAMSRNRAVIFFMGVPF